MAAMLAENRQGEGPARTPGWRQCLGGLARGLRRPGPGLGMICLLSSSLAACVSYVDVRSPAKGSLDNPVECGSPLDQRGYLKRLRGGELKRRMRYEYLDSVPGPRDVILDRFRVENPAPDTRGLGTTLLDLFRSEPKYPPAFRVYMSIYGDSPCQLEPVPGYEFLEPDTSEREARRD